MIFEVLFTDEETICVAIDQATFNAIHQYLILEAYHHGQKKAEKKTEEDEE